MAAKKSVYIILLVLLLLFVSIDAALSEETKGAESKYLSGIEFLTGFGHARLRGDGDYQIAPLFIDMDFDLKRVFNKYPGLFEFVIEPFFSYAWEPENDIEMGNNFALKLGILPKDIKLQPYIKFGAGLIYISLHTKQQSTHFNFNEYAGAGAHYFFKKDTALTLEYRFRHISNADIKRPNGGIDTNFAICGLSFLF